MTRVPNSQIMSLMATAALFAAEMPVRPRADIQTAPPPPDDPVKRAERKARKAAKKAKKGKR